MTVQPESPIVGGGIYQIEHDFFDSDRRISNEKNIHLGNIYKKINAWPLFTL